MRPRPGPFVAAAGAIALAAAALRTAWAEREYVRGLDLASTVKTSPAADVPGRLEAYEEARRRDPGQGEYALRAGQIRLSRVRREGGTDVAELAAARGLLRAAAKLRPLDFRPRAELARAAMFGGDVETAAREAATAVRLGPRAKGALDAAVVVELWAWTATGDAGRLRSAVAAGLALGRIGDTGPERRFVAAFTAAGGASAGDFVEATADDPALARFAAKALRRAGRAEVAELLEEAARREPPR